MTDLQQLAHWPRVQKAIDALEGDTEFDLLRIGNGLPTAAEMGFAGPYYQDLGLWLVANATDPPRELSLKPCTIVGASQLAWRKKIRDYFVELVGFWP